MFHKNLSPLDFSKMILPGKFPISLVGSPQFWQCLYYCFNPCQDLLKLNLAGSILAGSIVASSILAGYILAGSILAGSSIILQVLQSYSGGLQSCWMVIFNVCPFPYLWFESRALYILDFSDLKNFHVSNI